MTEDQNKQMEAAYQKELAEGTITNLDGSVGFKLGYLASLGTSTEKKEPCAKCGGVLRATDFKRVGLKINWSDHDSISNLHEFTINNDRFTSDQINKQCLVITCGCCGHKKATEIKESCT
jgi:hypothetical protein